LSRTISVAASVDECMRALGQFDSTGSLVKTTLSRLFIAAARTPDAVGQYLLMLSWATRPSRIVSTWPRESLIHPRTAFAEATRRHRRELHVYCYRMLGSFDEAEDHVQEVFLRAWRYRDSFHEQATVRTWLYRIATNACLDTLRQHNRRLPAARSGTPGRSPR
jgi:hypothetical protein